MMASQSTSQNDANNPPPQQKAKKPFPRPRPQFKNREFLNPIKQSNTSTPNKYKSQPEVGTDVYVTSAQDDEFPRPGSNEMLQMIVKLLTRTGCDPPGEQIEEEQACQSLDNEMQPEVALKMALFENGGDRGRHLSMDYDYLLTVTPINVEPERIFSATGLLCSKIGSRLGDKTLDSLIFLRACYNEENIEL
ncbi:unnamed protein product [Colias eurytheme]|nr:unnamed protein product [Colias eurytheme]